MYRSLKILKLFVHPRQKGKTFDFCPWPWPVVVANVAVARGQDKLENVVIPNLDGIALQPETINTYPIKLFTIVRVHPKHTLNKYVYRVGKTLSAIANDYNHILNHLRTLFRHLGFRCGRSAAAAPMIFTLATGTLVHRILRFQINGCRSM